MKNLKILSFITVLFTVFGLSSCSEPEPIDPAIVIPSPNPNNPNPSAPAVFKVDFDGQTYVATGTLVYVSGGSIIINAFKPDGSNFAIALDGTSAGTYPANENIVAYTSAGSEFGWWGNHPTDPNADTGSVVITSVDTQNGLLSGTFSFTGYWSDMSDETVGPKTFTNGVFTNLPFVSENPSGDSFFANVNGNEFDDTDVFLSEITVGAQQYYNIFAEDAEGATISINIDTDLDEGIYSITGNSSIDTISIRYSPDDQTASNDADAGTLTITEKTEERIRGTFSAPVNVGGNTYNLTQGTFDVHL